MDVPQRIVSLVPSHTESLHALDLADRVVGRTRFCIHPAEWVETLPHVGGTKDASFDKIMALNPDLVVVDKDENPLALVEQLRAAGVAVLWSEIDTVADAAEFLRVLGKACGASEKGEQLAVAIEKALADLQQVESLPVFCPIWHDPWMTFNQQAYPHAVLAAVGFHNAFAARTGDKYFEVSEQDVAASEAKFTLMPTEPYPFHKRRDVVHTEPLGPCGAPDNVLEIDGEALTWFGARTAEGLRDLAAVRARLV